MDGLTETYDLNEITDAIFTIADEDGFSEGMLNESTITDLLWNAFYENCYEDIVNAFVEMNRKENHAETKRGENGKMTKITFTTDAEIKNNAPELIEKLRNVSSPDEMSELADTYDLNEITDAIFTIAKESGMSKGMLNEETIADLLWDEFYENCYGEIATAFVEMNNEKRKEPTP